MEILTKENEKCLVSPEDFEFFSQKEISRYTNYLAYGSKFLHVHVIERMGFEAPKKANKMCIDHIDGDKLNNQRSNLRIVSSSENNRNVEKPKEKYSSNYRGVSWINKGAGLQGGKWTVSINSEGKKVYYAYYTNEHHAAHQYNIWCDKLNIETSIKNEIDPTYLEDFIEWKSTKVFHEHKNIKKTKYDRFQVEISAKEKRVNATFDTLEEAISFRDTEQKEINGIKLKNRREKFRKRLEELEITVDPDIFEEIYIGLIRYRKNTGFVYITLPGEKEVLLSRYIMKPKGSVLIEYRDSNKKNLVKVNLYMKEIRG